MRAHHCRVKQVRSSERAFHATSFSLRHGRRSLRPCRLQPCRDGAADHLIADGALPEDADFQSQLLVSAMTYLNAYAIPEGVSELEAFKALNLRRGELMDTVTGDEILARAKACVAKTPG